MTRTLGAAVLAGLALAATLTAGCSNEVEGSATSIGESAASALPRTDSDTPAGDDAGQGLPRNGAPAVPHPIADTKAWESTPCELLTKNQLAGLDFDPYRVQPQRDGGPGCSYDEVSVITARTTIGTELPDGLSGLYGEKASFKLFDEIGDIKGYPAVMADLSDRRKKGRCAIFIGIRDDLTYRTIVEADPKTRPGKNPCKFAADLIALAVHNMQNGS